MATDLHNNHTSSHDDDTRVVIHFDLDAFYVACERELNTELRGVPVAVSQYNPYGSLQETSPHDIYGRLVQTPNTTTTHDNTNQNGSLIAVSYEARAAGVKRNDRGLEACRKCPMLHIVVVPVKHGKANLSLYRSASKRVMQVLVNAIKQQSKTTRNDVPVEVASIDEVYVNVTELVEDMVVRMRTDNEFWKDCTEEVSKCTTVGGIEVLSDAAEAANALDKNAVRQGSRLQVLDSSTAVDQGSLTWWHRERPEWSDMEVRLACGALIAARARRAVVQAFDGGVFTLSAGISSNKTLAKLASGLKKPNRQTLINPSNLLALEKLFHPLPLSRIRGLGGKFGTRISELFQVTTVGQLSQIPLSTLQSKLNDDKTAQFLYDMVRGICKDAVTPRTKPKSIESSKTFRGKNSIISHEQEKLTKWVGELCNELTERLEADYEEYNRSPTTLVVSIRTSEEGKSTSKQCRAPRARFSETALQLIQHLVDAAKSRLQMESVTITCIAITATQFVEQASGSSTIMAAFERSKTTEGVVPLRTRSPLQSRKQPKPSMMDNWLLEGKNGGAKRSSGSVMESSAAKRRTNSEVASVRQQPFANRDTPLSGSIATLQPVALPTMEEIDPAVLRELPEELRASLMKDIGRAHPTKKTSGIQNFFHRKGA